LTIPARLGMAYASATPSICIESPAGMNPSNYNSGQPYCTFTTDGSSNILLTVTNLRTTGTTIYSYGLTVDGLTIGPAAYTNHLGGDAATGAFGITYAANSFIE
jgi:hypothetical protein